MIEVLNGELYQWDTGRQVKVDSDVCEVHFASCSSKNAYVTVPVNGVANIPNVLLQSGEYIVIYAMCENDSCEQTVEYVRAWIKQRPKPDDYVYTETEVFNYKTLEERIKKLEQNGGSSGGVAGVSDVLVNGTSIVDDGMANVPIASADEFGVVKQGNGLYMANGKLCVLVADTTHIDKRSKGPVLKVESLGHAIKSAMCTNIDAEWSADEKSRARARMGVDTWEEVANVTLDEDMTQVILNFEQPYKELYVYVSQDNVTEVMTGNLYVHPLLLGDTTSSPLRQYVGAKISTSFPDVVLKCINHNDMFIEVCNATCNAQKNTTTYQQYVKYHDRTFNDKITNYESLNFYGLFCSVCKAGTRIRVLGVRA